MSKKSHPMQPLVVDDGVLRFRRNAIVAHLLESGKDDMNSLAIMPFSQVDREQFAQLIGYSVSGFGDLSYAKDKTVFEADRRARRLYAKLRKGKANEQQRTD